jgi:hypothetical protein
MHARAAVPDPGPVNSVPDAVRIRTSPAFAKQLDSLARDIALETDATDLERARAVTEAELDLARVGRAKVSLIERCLDVRRSGICQPV